MKRYKLTRDNVPRQTLEGHEIVDGVESRQIVVIGLFSADGKLVGLDLPESETCSPAEDASHVNDLPVSPEERAAGEEAYRIWRAEHPPLPHPPCKPFNPDFPRIELSDEEFEAFTKALEQQRRSEPWRNPWDLPS